MRPLASRNRLTRAFNWALNRFTVVPLYIEPIISKPGVNALHKMCLTNRTNCPYVSFMISDFREVIDLWPSQIALAEDVGANPESVRKWRARNRIPPGFWAQIDMAATSRSILGISCNLLAEIAAKHRAAA